MLLTQLTAFSCVVGTCGTVDVKNNGVCVLLHRVDNLMDGKLTIHRRAEKAVSEHEAAEAPELCEYVHCNCDPHCAAGPARCGEAGRSEAGDLSTLMSSSTSLTQNICWLCVYACVSTRSYDGPVLDLDAGGCSEAAIWRVFPVLLLRHCAVLHFLVLHALVHPVRPQGRAQALRCTCEQIDQLISSIGLKERTHTSGDLATVNV